MILDTTNGGGPRVCQDCGLTHDGRCPNIKAIEYYPDGMVKRVEFFAPNDYMQKIGGWLPAPEQRPETGYNYIDNLPGFAPNA
jgi:hypothetical protein